MDIKVETLQTKFSLDGTTFSVMGGERTITTPARMMRVTKADMPPSWEEVPIKPSAQPRFGQRDYAASRFAIGGDKAIVSFETIVYNDQKLATSVLMAMLSRMGFLRLTKVDVGDTGAMIEVEGRPGKRMKAVAFVERNVFGLIMLSCNPNCVASDSWLISMARLMASRMN